MSTFQPFHLERILSKWENTVEYNLSESGIHPITVHQLVDDSATIEELLNAELNYPPCNGTVELRENIAALYPDATPDKLAYQRVEERQRRGKEQPQPKSEQPVRGDEVILHETEEEASESAPTEPPAAPSRTEHIDVEG